MEDRERLRVVLKHLIEHNEGHAEDYKRWIDLAQNAGMNTVAGLIREANDHAEKASGALKKALDLID
jgi:DNA-binding ferritin-like protein